MEESATLVAVIVTVCGALMIDGAVYSPFDRLPMVAFMDQVTAVFPVPVIVAVNCALCVGASVAVEGLTRMLRSLGINWTVAVPDLEGSTTLTALMVTVCGLVITEGAV